MAWRLQILSGTRKGETLELTGEYITIGRARDNTLRFTDESVSDHHAMITGEGDSYKLWDLHSRQGTHVNGEGIVVKILKPGDQVRIGTVETRYEQAKHKTTPIAVPQVLEKLPAPPAPAPEVKKPQGESSKPAPPLPAISVKTETAKSLPAPKKEEDAVIRPQVTVLGASQHPAPQPENKQPPQPKPAPSRPEPLVKGNAPGSSSGTEQPVEVKREQVRGRPVWLGDFLIYAIVFGVGVGVFFAGYPTQQNMLKFIGIVMAAVGAVSLSFVAMFGSVISPAKKKP